MDLSEVKGIWTERGYIRTYWPTLSPLSTNQITVLKGLAEKAPTNAYQVAEKTGKAYSFVFNCFKECEKRGIITLIREMKTKKGTKAKIYDLTLDGVLLLLSKILINKSIYSHGDIGENRTLFYKMMDRYSSMLPLVFGKYDYFKKNELDKLYHIRLSFMTRGYPDSYRKGTGIYPELEMEEQIMRYFYLFDFDMLDEPFIKDFDKRTWLTVLKNDPEIREYILKELESDQKKVQNSEKRIIEIVSFLKK